MTIAPLMSLAAVAGGALAGAAAQSIGSATSAFADLLHPAPAKEEEETQPMMLEKLPTTLAGIEAAAREALAKFQQLLAPKLAELGIDTAQPINLAIDGLGNIRETGGHPQAAEIEHLLETNDDIARYFRKAAAEFESVRAAREHQQFAQVYANNPELAVEQYAHLFDDRREPPKFSLRLTGDTAEPLFE